MSPDDFSFIARLLKERSGLSIGEDKIYLLESRLMPVVRKNGFTTIEELITSIKGKNIALAEEVTEAMTTNESFFFRDIKPFEQFKQIVLPAMLKERATKKTLRIWCAACSSGQEPYSLAMILNEEKAQLQGWRIEIIGTDISKEILQKAKEGKYSQFEVQRGLPVNLLVKYFEKQDESWIISSEIRSKVNYKYWNLLEDIKALGVFDVVFCRNVLIYFDHPTKSKVLAKIAAQMSPDGFLYLGGAETVLGVSNRFKPVPGQRGVYIINAAGDSLTPNSFVPNAAATTQAPTATTNMIKQPSAFGTNVKAPVATPPSTITKTPPVASPTGIKAPTTIVKKPIATPFVNRPTINPASRPMVNPNSGSTPPQAVPRPTPSPVSPQTPVQQTVVTQDGKTIIRKVIIKKPISPNQ